MKILVTQFYTKNVQYAHHTIEINKKYCERHGYEYFVEDDTSKIKTELEGRSPTWYKPKLMLDVLERFNPDYVLFLDIDAVFVDFEDKIENYISPDHDLLFTDDFSVHSKMNAGVFIAKNTEWVRETMTKWWDIADTLVGKDVPNLVISPGWEERAGYYKTGLWHDQSCLTYLYLNDNTFRQKTKIITHRKLNWREPFDKNFIFHAFAYGHLPLRQLNYVHGKLFGATEQTKGKTLAELANLYPSDKELGHQYFSRAYDELFAPVRDTTKMVVEIGVREGFSISTWKDYFENAHIVGIDIDEQCRSIVEGTNRVSFLLGDTGNQHDLELLQSRLQNVDILIDDGGHKMHEQQLALAYLFSCLRDGGMYVLEDLHTSTEAKMPSKAVFGWGDPEKTTTLDMLRNFQVTGCIVSDYLTHEQAKYLEENIESVTIYDDKGDDVSITSVIRKKVIPTPVVETPTEIPSVLTKLANSIKQFFTR